MKRNSGNILFIILIAVALFSALTYTTTKSSRVGNSAGISNEQEKLDRGVAEQCSAHIQRGINILQIINGCSLEQISYELPSGLNENPNNPDDKNCFLFDQAGAGIFACGIYESGDCPSEILTSLDIGEIGCGNIVYTGNNGSGERIYTTLADNAGFYSWASSTPSVYRVTGASSGSNGQYNTDLLLSTTGNSSPFPAAASCVALGDKWYLPARNEFKTILYPNKNVGALDGSFAGTSYWTSTEHNNGASFNILIADNSHPTNFKGSSRSVRCLRKD